MKTFPEYLDYLSQRQFSLDISAQIAHGALRYYAMGERGRLNEDATEGDIAEMAKLVTEALEAGAVGFSTSRIVGQKKAREIWFLCRQYNAQQALEMGLVNLSLIHI